MLMKQYKMLIQESNSVSFSINNFRRKHMIKTEEYNKMIVKWNDMMKEKQVSPAILYLNF